MNLEALPHRLATGLVRVAIAMHLAADDPAAALERTIAQQQLLLLLSQRRNGYTLSELAADVGMTPPATASSIDTLVREGLVVLGPAAAAPWDVCVTITDRGREQTPELLHWASDLLAEFRKLDEAAQRQLLQVVTGHIRRLQLQGQIPVVKMCFTCRFFDGYAHPGTADPHHCRLVDAAFGHQLLRLRCPEQEPAAGLPQTQ